MPAAVEYLLSIDGITTGDVPFESYSFGALNAGSPSTGGGGGVGKVSFNPFSITRKIDKASPVLFRACATGRHIKDAHLTLRAAAKGTPTMTIVLRNVLIAGISEAGNVHGGATPLEEIGFLFQVFEITVDGVTFGYDLDRGRVV